MSHAVDVFDLVDMLEKKYKFERQDAKMLIDFKQERAATKDDLNYIKMELDNKIDFSKQEIESKIDLTKRELEDRIKDEIQSVKDEIRDVKDEIRDLRKEFSVMRVTGGAILISVFVQILATVFSR